MSDCVSVCVCTLCCFHCISWRMGGAAVFQDCGRSNCIGRSDDGCRMKSFAVNMSGNAGAVRASSGSDSEPESEVNDEKGHEEAVQDLR